MPKYLGLIIELPL